MNIKKYINIILYCYNLLYIFILNLKMKLFSEKISKHKFIVILVSVFFKIVAIILLFTSYKSPYLKVFDDTKEVSIEKTITITHTINELIKLSLFRYIQDLKLIGRHMFFLANNGINKNSKYYKNIKNDSNKQIFYATVDKLKSNFSYYYNEENGKFEYLERYTKDYLDNADKRSSLLNEFMNSSIHPELNSISYYKYGYNVINFNALDEEPDKKTAVKYLISILKTNYIKRLEIKGSDFETRNYFLLMEDEIYLYPPEAYNNSFIYSIQSLFGCQNKPFPNCVYNTFLGNYKSSINNTNYLIPTITPLKTNYEEVGNAVCMIIPFEKKYDIVNFTYNPLMCIQINLSHIFSSDYFGEKDAFSFVFFSISRDSSGGRTFIPIFNNKKGAYEEVKKIFNDTKFKHYSLNVLKRFSLFHFLYLDLFKEPSLLKQNGISMDYILEEFEIITLKIFEEIAKYTRNRTEYFSFEIEKTICDSEIHNNGKKCFKDIILLVINPLSINFNLFNELYIDNSNYHSNQVLFYSMSFINNHYNYMKWKINTIILVKIIKLFFFYFIATICIIYLYFTFAEIFYENKYFSINQILKLICKDSFLEIKDKNEITQKSKEIEINVNNKEMIELKNLFNYIIKTMLLKINFQQNESKQYVCQEKKEKKIKAMTNNKIIKAKKTLKKKNKNNNELYEYIDIINNIDEKGIQIMFAFIISYEHFREGYYKLSEKEFKNLIMEISSFQNKMMSKNENDESKLKDTISRCSKISYLNEYSLTNELSETILPIIKLKLMSQKIYYLYALSIYNQIKIKTSGFKKNNKENIKKRYEEAIKYFTVCKNISILLGTDIIRQIFSLIMISKCYIELKNYKESMININEALLLFSELQKSFKDKPYFYPKVMMFTENYIFQSIMLTLAQATYNFNKYSQSCWILMKMIETSPFVFNMIHFQACFLLWQNLNQIDNSFNLPYRQIDKYKKKIYKMFSRINVRLLFSKEKISNIDSSRNSNINNKISNPSINNIQVNTLNVSIDNKGNPNNLKRLTRNKEIAAGGFSASLSSLTNNTKNHFKNITLCVSEKLLVDINGEELKDVIIKFFKKCFSDEIEEDKFGFIQFSYNGKKTISMKSDSISMFLQKLESNKIAFKLNDIYIKNYKQIQFMEFSNLFLSIIKSDKQVNSEEKGDNIIIIFINTCDIRFNGQKECVDTINELNINNYSVIIFTYDTEIEKEKIEGIYSFVYGLNDGHFFQVQNYQQIKQVFMNFCVKDSQESFNNYNYKITDIML